MKEKELKNWQRIKEYFESMPDFKREYMFYIRACDIVKGKPDPLK